MMNDTPSSNDAGSMEAQVTKAGEAIGEGVQSATAATAGAAGQAKTVLGDAGEAAQQAWSQAGEVVEDVVDAGRRATRSVSRQIHENPLMSVLVGCALGYVAGWWIHGGGSRPGAPADDKACVKRAKGRASGTK
jgi:ElaB/YqjD/DUF883 family membrane-anchored ribosome-binding protein